MLLQQDLTATEWTLFTELLWKLGSEKKQDDLRRNILADITRLLRADFAASYIWDEKTQLSKHGLLWEIDQKALHEYERIWQHDDPITAALRQCQKPTFVQEVITFEALNKTAYYHEFLKPYGLYHGLNVYFVRDGEDIGDLRIWRAADAQMFTGREKRILNILEPYIRQALPMHHIKADVLTPRERDVAILVAKGLSDKKVACLLNISFTTVRTHLKNAMYKLGCHNRTEMARLLFYPEAP